jgi:hypothetical protein
VPKPVTSSWTLLASRQNRRRKMMTPTAPIPSYAVTAREDSRPLDTGHGGGAVEPNN